VPIKCIYSRREKESVRERERGGGSKRESERERERERGERKGKREGEREGERSQFQPAINYSSN